MVVSGLLGSSTDTPPLTSQLWNPPPPLGALTLWVEWMERVLVFSVKSLPSTLIFSFSRFGALETGPRG